MPKKEEKIRLNIWKISSIILLILLIASIFTSGFGLFSNYKLSSQQAQDLVVNFVNQNIPEGTAIPISIEKQSGFYAVTLQVSGETGVVYLSSDGKLLFPAAIPVEQ